MPEKQRRVLKPILLMLGMTLLVACQSEEKTVTVEVTRVVRETVVKTVDVAVEVEVEVAAEATLSQNETLPKVLTICMTQEPASLYPYAGAMLAEEAVLHAIFENNITSLSYAYQPQGIERVPSLTNGDVAVKMVTVGDGDKVVDARGEVIRLKEGDTVLDATGQEMVFDGNALQMNQLVVVFTMKPRVWSDGQPVTAADSVFSFKLDSDPDTPSTKFEVKRTDSYEATGDLSLRWTGLPGYRHATYVTHFWRPLPRHLWQGFSAAELLEADESNHRPVGDGPFQIVEWVAGDHIRLERNKYYYRADQGLPNLDGITFKFIPDAGRLVSSMLSGQCDIVTHDGLDIGQTPLLLEAEANGLLKPYYQTGTIYELIAFGIDSWGRYGDGDRRPDWFEDVRVRQAMVMCTDRQRMIDQVLYGRSRISHSYVPDIHPLYPQELQTWPYDVTAANRLLDEAGYLDIDGDGVRQDPLTGDPFRVTLHTTPNYQKNLQLAALFRENMLDCGIDIQLYYLPPDEWFAPGSDSPLFGRRFDLGHLAWPAGHEPLCLLYTSGQITGPAGEINRETGKPYAGWNGMNATGWWDPQFDAFCKTAANALPGSAEYVDAHRQAQLIFSQNVPVIPLFPRVKVATASPRVLNFNLDPTQPSELWNLFEIDLQR
jgi:peptide/nickel transport system substrate-binding protein